MSETACPECRAPLKPVTGFVNWCTSCEWNLEPGKEAPAHDMFEAFYKRLSSRLGKALHESLIGQNLMEASSHGRSWYLAMGFSMLVVSLYLFLWPLGLWLLIAAGGQFIKITTGLLVLALALFAWPWRRDPLPKQDIVPRSQLPQLYALIDQISGLLKAPALTGIVLTEHYNASVRQFGWRRRSVLYLGIPLWEMLSVEERLSVLGHEIGHLVNRDPMNNRLPALAFTILFKTGHAICPEKLVPKGLTHGRVVMAEEWAAVSGAMLLMIPVNLALAMIARGFWATGHVLLGLLWAESQRAEYRADLLGMQLSGMEPALSEMEKLTGADLVWSEVRERINRRQQNADTELFTSIRTRWANLPETEKERRRRLLRQEHHRLDATHPATVFRMEMLKAQRKHIRQLQIPGRDWKALDSELESARQKIAHKLLDRLRNSLYYG